MKAEASKQADSKQSATVSAGVQQNLAVQTGITEHLPDAETDLPDRQVMRMPCAPLVQRKCNCDDNLYDDDHVRMKSINSIMPPFIQRMEDDGGTQQQTPAVSTPQTAAASPATAQQGKFIVDDGSTPADGQMTKSDFLAQLNTEVCQTVNDALQGTQYTSDNCPYIKAVFARHQNTPANQLEQIIMRYEPAAAAAQTLTDLMAAINAHVATATAQWAQTGQMPALPDEGAITQSAAAPAATDNSGSGTVSLKANEGGAQSMQSPASVMQSLGKGNSMEGSTRSKMENAFGTSFSDVEVHTDSNAASLSGSMNARAFAVGNHIAFGNSQHKPGTLEGDALMAHELAHVIQQKGMSTGSSHSESALEEDADRTAVNVMRKTLSGKDEGALKKENSGLKGGLKISRCDVHRTPEEDLIAANAYPNISFNFKGLASALLPKAEAGDYGFIQRVLDDLGTTVRDDLSLEFMNLVTDDSVLEKFAATPEGRAMLDRFFDELTSGHVAEDEQKQADRIMRIKTKATVTPEEYDKQINSPGIKIFPFRPGIHFSDAHISASRGANGTIIVDIPVHTLGDDMFKKEVQTLNGEFHFVLPENEIVGVKMYDLGGPIVYRPALFFIQLANADEAETIEDVLWVAGTVATLGSGSLAAGATTKLGQAVLWADRIAFSVNTAAFIIRQQRGWIIEKYGKTGEDFLHYVDLVNYAAGVYGGGRALVGMTQLISNLGKSSAAWKEAVNSSTSSLSETEKGAVNQLNKVADDTINEVNELEKAKAASGSGGETVTNVAGTGPVASDGTSSGVKSQQPLNKTGQPETIAADTRLLPGKEIPSSASSEQIPGAGKASFDDLIARAEKPTPRQATGTFRSNLAREGNREAIIIEGRVSDKIPQSESIAHYTETIENEHATHSVAMQNGENLPEGVTSAPARFNLSEMKVVEETIRKTADAAAIHGAFVETKTIAMVEYISEGGNEIRVLVGIKRQAWLVIPGSDNTALFVDFSATIDAETRIVTIIKNWIQTPAKR